MTDSDNFDYASTGSLITIPLTTGINSNVTLLTCEDIASLRISSLIFTFLATVFLCYVIIVLLLHVYKKKQLVECKGKEILQMGVGLF